MDQNTTLVPKIRQSVKGIEGRYVKTRLCGVLVHRGRLYSNIWIDSHHKHDSNQVITSIMYAIADMKARRGEPYGFKRTTVAEKTRTNTCSVCVLHLLVWAILRRYIRFSSCWAHA